MGCGLMAVQFGDGNGWLIAFGFGIGRGPFFGSDRMVRRKFVSCFGLVMWCWSKFLGVVLERFFLGVNSRSKSLNVDCENYAKFLKDD